MSHDVSTSLARIGKEAARLNALTDKGAVSVKILEDYLNKCSTGIEVWILLTESVDTNNGETERESFGFGRVGARFRVAYAFSNNFDPDSAYQKPWSDCSREIKLRTLPLIPELIQKIANETEKNALAAEKALGDIGRSLGEFAKTIPQKVKKGEFDDL